MAGFEVATEGGECKYEGEWEYLLGFRDQAVQPVPRDETVSASLRRRQLVKKTENQFELCAPLMARWLRDRA